MFSLKTISITSCLLALAVPALGLSSISALSAGLAWLFISLAGVMAWLNHKAKPPLQPEHGPHPALSTALWWLIACLSAFVLMAIPTAYWGGPWSERHGQWRLMIGALGLWCLLRYNVTPARTVQALATAAAVSSLFAYGLVVISGSSAAPTNRIPWMAGLTLLSCALLSLSYSLHSTAIRLQLFWLAASSVMLVTALLSGVRGSWPLLLVWPLMLWRLHRSAPLLWGLAWKWIVPLLVVLLMTGLHFISEADNPTARITAVLLETAPSTNEAPVSQDSSSGVRLALYKLGMANVLDHPLLGIGPVKTKLLIKGALTDVGAYGQLAAIGHMHSDLLHPWMEFGVFGLAAYLVYAVGLAFATWQLGSTSAPPALSCGLMALLLMHLSTGLTNMNFAHNYYPLMLALSTALVMLGGQNTPSQAKA